MDRKKKKSGIMMFKTSMFNPSVLFSVHAWLGSQLLSAVSEVFPNRLQEWLLLLAGVLSPLPPSDWHPAHSHSHLLAQEASA